MSLLNLSVFKTQPRYRTTDTQWSTLYNTAHSFVFFFSILELKSFSFFSSPAFHELQRAHLFTNMKLFKYLLIKHLPLSSGKQTLVLQ